MGRERQPVEVVGFILALLVFGIAPAHLGRAEGPQASAAAPQDKLPWWPTDAQPGPVQDKENGGYWWWPSTPGTVKDLWGNRGYGYVNKLIYNWRGGVGKNVQVTVTDVKFVETEPKPSLLIKNRIRDLNLHFEDNTSAIGLAQAPMLKKVLESLKLNPKASILITSDAATGEAAALGEKRAKAVESYFLEQKVAKERIKVVGEGKFEEAGLSSKKQKDPGRVQVLIAEVVEVMVPGPKE
jgi:outer membrane protein OmpA-like peptidoglycan-associated protein